MLLAQNGKLIGRRRFELAHDDSDRLRRLMPYADLGTLTGSMADIQIFSKPFIQEDLEKWTLCEKTSEVCKIPIIKSSDHR